MSICSDYAFGNTWSDVMLLNGQDKTKRRLIEFGRNVLHKSCNPTHSNLGIFMGGVGGFFLDAIGHSH